MPDFDDAVLNCFLENQGQLFPEGDVCESLEEARDFLEECFAVVVNSPEEVMDYLSEEEGYDVEDMSVESILDIEEVFDVGDGRYLIVEGFTIFPNNRTFKITGLADIGHSDKLAILEGEEDKGDD